VTLVGVTKTHMHYNGDVRTWNNFF